MPIVEIPEKDMVVEFPDDMSAEEIEDSIYQHVYDTPTMRAAEKPGLIERGKQAVTDQFRGPEPGVGPVSGEDFRAFEPDQYDADIPRPPAPEAEGPGYEELKDSQLSEIKTPVSEPQPEPQGRNIPEPRYKHGSKEQKEQQQSIKGALKDMGATAQQIGKVYPVLEAIGYWTTQPIAAAVSGLAGAGMKAAGKEDKEVLDTMQTIQEVIGYEPYTEEGKAFTGTTEYPFRKLEEGAGAAGEKTLEATESPEWATLVHTIIAGAPALAMGLRPGKAGARKISDGVKKGWDLFLKSETGRAYTKMSAEKRVKAAERAGKDLADLLKENPDLTEAQIARISKQQFGKYYEQMRAERATGEAGQVPGRQPTTEPVAETTSPVPGRAADVRPPRQPKIPTEAPQRPAEAPTPAQRPTAPETPRSPSMEQTVRPEQARVPMGDLVKQKLEERGIVLEQPGQPEALPAPEAPAGEASLELSGRRQQEQPPAQERRTGQDRRQDMETRRKVAEMSPEEMREALLKDDMTGLWNRRAYDEAEKLPVQGFADVDGLKWINDNISHQAGDELLKAVGEAFADHPESYHVTGDEFVVQGRTPEEVDTVLKNAENKLKDKEIVWTDGSGTEHTFKPRFSYGKGRTIEEADRAVQAEKSARELRGDRAGRGQEPPGYRKKTPGRKADRAEEKAEVGLSGKPLPRPQKTAKKEAMTSERGKGDITTGQPPQAPKGGEVVTLYHGGPEKEITGIRDEGLFGGIFADLEPDIIKAHGDYGHQIQINKSDILTKDELWKLSLDSGSSRQIDKAIKKSAPDLTSDEFGIIYESVVNEKDTWDLADQYSEETVIGAFQKFNDTITDLSEAGWAAQNIRGKIAKEFGYKAVETADEHGTTYLVLPGAEISPYPKPSRPAGEPGTEAPARPSEPTGPTETTIKPEVPPKQAEALSPKEQKQHLVDQIDKAIKQAPEVQEGQAETVSIEVPGDGEFHLMNTKAALKEVKKKVESVWPISVPKKPPAKKGPSRPIKNRVESEENGTVEYYNEFKPRSQKKVIAGKATVWRDNFYSSGSYMIKLPEKPKLTKTQQAELQTGETAPDLKGMLKESAKPARFMGETAAPDMPDPMIHVRSDHGDYLYRAEILDNILTHYPNAKPHMAKSSLLIFKDGKTPVAGAMPIEGQAQKLLSDYQARRFKEIHGEEIAPAAPEATEAPQTATGTEASGAEYAKDADFKSRYTGPDTSDFTGRYGSGGNTPAAMDMPEIVELVRALQDGKLPKVMKKLRVRNAAGLFRHTDQQGSIELVASIFKDPEIARKVMAHEIGHLVDWLPDKMLERGNLLGRVASLKRNMARSISLDPKQKPYLSKGEKAELLEEAKKLAKREADKLIDKEITKTLPITPEDVLAIWNELKPEETVGREMIDYVKSLGSAAKKSIVKQALKGQTPEELKGFAKTITEKTGEKQRAGGYPQHLSEIYKDLIQKELARRKVIHDRQIRDELKAFTREWKPFDPAKDPKYTKYRYSSRELYADAISGLVTNPAVLKHHAPTFYKAFFNYMDRKPQVARAYEQIQEDISRGPEDLAEQRSERLKAGFKSGAELRRERMKAAQKENQPGLGHAIESLLTWFDDKNAPVYGRIIRKYEREKDAQGKLTKRAKQVRELRYRIGELENFATMAQGYLLDLRKQVLTPLRQNDISMLDLDYYLFQKRVIGDRYDIANPGGNYKELSEKDLSAMLRKWGTQKAQTIQKAAWEFRDLREKEVLPILEDSGLYSPKLMEKMWNTPDYVTFSVNKYLSDQYGTGITGKIYQQFGTLQDVGSLVEATMIKDIQTMRAALTNKLKQEFEAAAKEVGNILEDAEMYYSRDYQKRMPKDPKERGKDIFTVFHGGKPVHYYVDKAIADVFQYDPVRAHGFERVMTMLGRVPRELYVAKNPEWMIRNIARDYMETAQKLSDVKIRTLPRLAKLYKEAYKDVAKYIYKGEVSPDMREMMRYGMFPVSRMWGGTDPTVSGEIVDVIREAVPEFAEESAKKYPEAEKHLKRVWDQASKTGKVGIWAWEQADKAASMTEVAGKVAAYKYLIENAPEKSMAEIGRKVRDMAATPNIKQRGTLNNWTNNLYPFSTVGRNGLKATYASLRDDPGLYIWKTTVFNVIPALVRHGFKAGTILYLMEYILNEEDPDNDKQMSMIERTFKGEERARANITDERLAEMDAKQRSKLREFISKNIGAVKHITRMYRGIPEYQMKNWHCIPLYLREDGKTVYLRIPQDYEGMYISRLTSDLIKREFTGPGGMITSFENWSPYNLNEFIKQPKIWLEYFGMGRTPVDEWTGQTILTRQEEQAGGKYAAGRLAKHSWSAIGGRLIYEPAWGKLETDRDAWEEFLNTQPGKILGSWVKISDKGLIEEFYDRVEQERTRKAAESLERKDAYIKLANGEMIDMEGALYILTDSPKQRQKKLIDQLTRKSGTAYARMLRSANTKQEKAIALQLMLEQNFRQKPME